MPGADNPDLRLGSAFLHGCTGGHDVFVNGVITGLDVDTHYLSVVCGFDKRFNFFAI